jgi:hypothetical protein
LIGMVSVHLFFLHCITEAHNLVCRSRNIYHRIRFERSSRCKQN